MATSIPGQLGGVKMKAQRTIRRKSYARLIFLVLLAIGLGTACNDDAGLFRGADDFRFGSITVRAFDQQNSPVAGATMELRDGRGNLVLEDLNNTGVDGSVGFSPLTPGFYTITIKPPAGYAIPASQSNPIGVQVRNTQSITVNVFLFAG
jgi:prealbumin domain-containing protein